MRRVLRRQPYFNRSVFTDPIDGQIVEPRNVNTFCAARKPVPDQIFKSTVRTRPTCSVLVPGRPDGSGVRAQVRNVFPLEFFKLAMNQRTLADNSTVTVATHTDNY